MTPPDPNLPHPIRLDADPTAPATLRRLLETEWLLTNGLGGFAMGTAAGTPSRRYHALLVAALTPPVSRIVALNALVDRLILDPGTPHQRAFELSTFRFATDDPAHAAPGVLHPDGLSRLVSFEKTAHGACEWTYEVRHGEIALRITRTLHLFRGRNTAAVRYRVEAAPGRHAWAIDVRPLVSIRDYHHLLHEGWGEMFRVEPVHRGVLVRRSELWAGDWPPLRLLAAGEGASFQPDGHWWRRFRYDAERERGMEDREDLFCPGVFTWSGEGRDLTLYASTDPLEAATFPSIEEDQAARAGRVASLVAAVRALTPKAREESRGPLAALAAASDDFPVVRTPPSAPRAPVHSKLCSSIIAGYPWFADWGRDTMISLPGLCLVTGRHEEALAILRTFAAHCRDGLIPNRFDDNTSHPYYNTADASLWYLHAATEYLRLTGDRAGFDAELKQACLEVVDNYRSGTHVPASDHGGTIRMDPRDYLIAAGSEATQLTWMDARRDGVIFTPRHGKPVELSALWHHGLLALAEALSAPDGDLSDRILAADLRSLGAAVATSFQRRFFSEPLGCCFDRLVPPPSPPIHEAPRRTTIAEREWTGVAEVRPNQVFAVSLPNSPLTPPQQRAVIAKVRDRLLTRHGLRTLDPADPNYRGRFTGSLFDRDAAYHTGTAWPWLLPPLAEAVMRVENFSAASRAEAARMLEPMVRWLTESGCGQIPEVFDGDDEPQAGAPQRAGGCPAQAWSVAETLRVLVMAESGRRPR